MHGALRGAPRAPPPNMETAPGCAGRGPCLQPAEGLDHLACGSTLTCAPAKTRLTSGLRAGALVTGLRDPDTIKPQLKTALETLRAVSLPPDSYLCLLPPGETVAFNVNTENPPSQLAEAARLRAWERHRGRARGDARPPARTLLLPRQWLPVTGQPSPGLAIHQP